MNCKKVDELFDKLWPITRSITGPGITESLTILQDYIPIDIVEVPTNTKVFDWVVPPEWQLNHASLYTEDGEKVISTEDNNLHVLNFSEPFSGTLDFEDLEKHLYTDENSPCAVPYVTSYYVRRWGLCISAEQKATLDRNKKFRVEIDTKIFDGALRYGDFTLKGQSDETVLLSTDLCHPSLANNELSGPLSMVLLYDKLSKLENRYYSYRFIIIPETIGSITFLANSKADELDKICAGLCLTCLGGPFETLSFLHSRRHWIGEATKIDQLAESFSKSDPTAYSERVFTPSDGSDERQYCSPGINLPVLQVARTPPMRYDEYHTSLDTKEFMQISAVANSAERLALFLHVFELNAQRLLPVIEGGEPMLGKRGLYPSVNSPQTRCVSSDSIIDNRDQLNLLLNMISLIDGTRSVTEIVEFLSVSYGAVIPILDELIKKRLIRVLPSS